MAEANTMPPGLTDKQREMVTSVYPMTKHVGLRFARRYDLGFLAEEFVGVCILASVESAQKFDPTRGASFATYAWNLMVYRCRRHRDREFRRLNRNQSGDWNEGRFLREIPEKVAAGVKWSGPEWEELLNRLPKGKTREAFRLYYREGLTEPEIAARFGVSRARVWQLLARSRDSLSRILADEKWQ